MKPLHSFARKVKMDHLCHYLTPLLSLYLLSCFPPSIAQNNLKIKAVNLGNWLVIEGWMDSSLFERLNSEVSNSDLLDGTQVQFKSTKLQKYLCAENGGGSTLVANRGGASGWETFKLWRVSESSFNFRVFNRLFVGLENQGQGNNMVAVSNSPSNSETFQIIRNDQDRNRVRIKASNGFFLQAQTENQVTADYQGSGWEDDNPSVFEMTTVGSIQGEYQITNGYGPDRAPQVLQNHWDTYITEDDFGFMSTNGLNAVRIPVGWWIAFDPPPKPFVGGSLKALDNAFTWAQKYGMKVIIDLHAVKGSQNGDLHSGTRDGYLEWGDSNIQETVSVIDFLAERYATNPSLLAIELMNEPRASGVKLETLEAYYRAGYDAVRKYTTSAYVILSSRLEASASEFLQFSGTNVVIDVHYYNLFSDEFKKMNPQQQIDYINNKRSSDLNSIATSNGPLTFVGEWTSALDPEVGASDEDYRNFAKAQMDVYGRATFGWAYWAYNCMYEQWSLKQMIQKGLINLTGA